MKKLAVILIVLLLTMSTVFAAEADYEILVDPGFEENDDITWVPYVQSLLDFSEDAHEGESSLVVSERSHMTDIARQYVTEQLKYYGKGKYVAEAYVKLESETEHPVKIQVVLGVYGNEKKWITSDSVTVTDKEWTKLTFTKDVSWEGELKQAEFYFVTDEKFEGVEFEDMDFAEIMIDSCSLKPVGFTGDPYEEKVEETPAPTPKPTQKPTVTNAPSQTQGANATDGANTNEGGATATAAPVTVGQNKNQTIVVTCAFIASGVILAIGAVALFISYRKDKKNEKVK